MELISACETLIYGAEIHTAHQPSPQSRTFRHQQNRAFLSECISPSPHAPTLGKQIPPNSQLYLKKQRRFKTYSPYEKTIRFIKIEESNSDFFSASHWLQIHGIHGSLPISSSLRRQQEAIVVSKYRQIPRKIGGKRNFRRKRNFAQIRMQ